jgi:hypothetical protein
MKLYTISHCAQVNWTMFLGSCIRVRWRILLGWYETSSEHTKLIYPLDWSSLFALSSANRSNHLVLKPQCNHSGHLHSRDFTNYLTEHHVYMCWKLQPASNQPPLPRIWITSMLTWYWYKTLVPNQTILAMINDNSRSAIPYLRSVRQMNPDLSTICESPCTSAHPLRALLDI